MEHITTADLSNPEHARALVFLLNEYAKDEMGGQEELSGHVKANLAAALRQRPGAHAVLAYVDEQPAGLAICFEGFSTFACRPLLNIHDLVVLPAYRGRGLSKKLLGQVEAIARQLDCCKLTLEVLEGNTLAQAAYRGCGFDGYQLDPQTGKALFWQKKLA